MKIVLVGGGKVGAALARQLSEEGHNVTVVDTKATEFGPEKYMLFSEISSRRMPGPPAKSPGCRPATFPWPPA